MLKLVPIVGAEIPVSDREFGELSERVRGIQDDVTDLKGDMATLKSGVANIMSTLSTVRGGWKAIAAIAAIAAAAGGIVVKIVPLFIR